MASTAVRHWPIPAEPSIHPSVTLTLAAAQARYSLRARSPQGLPDQPMASARHGDGHALRIGPDEWLLILPEGSQPPEIAGAHALVDVGDRGIGIDIAGPGAAALVLTGCALDLDRSFPPGKASRTLYEGVEIILWRLDETRFRMEVWRSFAAHVWGVLDLAAGDLA